MPIRLLTSEEFLKLLGSSLKTKQVKVVKASADSDEVEAFGILLVELYPFESEYAKGTARPKLEMMLKVGLPIDVELHTSVNLKKILLKQVMLEVASYNLAVTPSKSKRKATSMQTYRIDGNRTRAKTAIDRMKFMTTEFVKYLERYV